MLTQRGQRTEGTIEQSLPREMQAALEQFQNAATVCEWCAERCVGEGPMMAECLRLCRDVADIASLNARFVARDSPYGPELAEHFIRIAEACARECAQHQHPHCQDCARLLRDAVRTTEGLLQWLATAGTAPQAGRQLPGGQQVGGQQVGGQPPMAAGQQPAGQQGAAEVTQPPIGR
jgi:hypothetical protein